MSFADGIERFVEWVRSEPLESDGYERSLEEMAARMLLGSRQRRYSALIQPVRPPTLTFAQPEDSPSTVTTVPLGTTARTLAVSEGADRRFTAAVVVFVVTVAASSARSTQTIVPLAFTQFQSPHTADNVTVDPAANATVPVVQVA